MTIRIRNVREEDFLAIMGIAASCAPMPVERDSIYHDLTRYFANTCLIAEDEDKIVGFLLGWVSQVDSSKAYLHDVCVIPEMRRRKIATDLYNRFFEAVNNMSCHKVYLIINPINKHSLDFHHNLGFKLSEEGDLIDLDGVRAVKDYNGPGKHMVVMYKNI